MTKCSLEHFYCGLPQKGSSRSLSAWGVPCEQMAQRMGVIIEVVPEDEEGDISIPDLERLIRQGDGPPVLIAITHVPTSSGTVALSLPMRESDTPSYGFEFEYLNLNFSTLPH